MASQVDAHQILSTKVKNGIEKAKTFNSSELPLSSSDIILCSSPKSGTTWLKSLAFSVVTRTRFDPFSKHHPILSSLSHNLIPFIEVEIAHDYTTRVAELPLLSTHMPFSFLPKSALDSGCKIVYIYRNPKDVFVSYWHFTKDMPNEVENWSLDKAFDLFCKGELLIFGDYWDHVLGYWEASKDCPKRMMFLKYESMMEDALSNVNKLAEFTGFPFSEDEDKLGVATRIVEMCSFGSLSSLEVNKTGKYQESLSNSSFFRKAKVGDWANYLTPDMADKLDEITLQKFTNTGLTL